ncbi:hypothetical protein NC986_06875 [Leptolyngbya sp. PL-A2]
MPTTTAAIDTIPRLHRRTAELATLNRLINQKYSVYLISVSLQPATVAQPSSCVPACLT